jgi:hypothetical protein
MKTLNGFTRPWDVFIQTICARKEKLQFDSLWEECVQEEARVANRETVLLRDEDQDCYRSVCSLGHRLEDKGQTGVTGTYPTQCHHNGEVLSI